MVNYSPADILTNLFDTHMRNTNYIHKKSNEEYILKELDLHNKVLHVHSEAKDITLTIPLDNLDVLESI